MERKTILVTGATGNVGRHVVAELRASGHPVRALTRSPADADLPAGVEVVRGELPGLDESVLDGVGPVFLVWPFTTADDAPPVIDLIARHASRVVFLSARGVPDDEEPRPDALFHAHLEALLRRSGVEWTFLRAGGFASNTLTWVDGVRDGVVRWIYGDAVRPLVHEHDLADVAVRVLTEPGHAGQRYELTGPDALTQVDQLRLIAEAVGKDVRWEELDVAAARRELLGRGWAPDFVEGGLAYWATLVDTPETVTKTVEEVTGKPARSFAEWARDHAAAFR